MNIDCQIRGKSDVHEALSTMCEVEYMEGDNKVFCDKCKKNTDTVLRTAISALPDMLILSLKRFDLDYNTFETVKLNSRCEFGQTLNMKRYTLEGVEAMEKANDAEAMPDANFDPLSALPDEDYEYRLAGVLVHHGVAQGGHYYSFIRDRTDGQNANEWFRFDDEDVTPFDASNIETECFGGKVKKETKWPNGQSNVVETEQLANALMLFYEKVKPTKFTEDSTRTTDTEMEESNENQVSSVRMVTGSDDFQADVNRSNTVHRSHSFLFGNEFQVFMKEMLDLFVSDLSSDDDESMASSSPILNLNEQDTASLWHLAILDTSLSFFFDVLLHSVEKKLLDGWRNSLGRALRLSKTGSLGFISELAKRSHLVADNWLRTYATDCPEARSREAAMEVIATAAESVLFVQEELIRLKSWTFAWQEQVHAWEKASAAFQNTSTLPTCLLAEGKCHEDLSSDNSKASILGVIVSFLCLLLEAAPRTWRYTPDLCSLLRSLGSIPSESGGDCIRDALLAAQIPARLICTIQREKAHPLLRTAMPAASLPAEVVEQTSKIESAPTSHLLPSVGMGSGVNSTGPSSGSPTPADHSKAIEALAAIIGIKGSNSALLISETGRSIKNRPVVDLTPAAKEALSTVFNENASKTGIMTQKDFLYYMKFCSGGEVSQQRVATILNKYGKDSNYLTLDGFLAHYRDASQSGEIQVRSKYEVIGFGPLYHRFTRTLTLHFFSSGSF